MNSQQLTIESTNKESFSDVIVVQPIDFYLVKTISSCIYEDVFRADNFSK